MCRRLVLALALLLTIGATSTFAQATLKQVVGSCATSGGGGTSCTITPSVAIVAGDALVAIMGGSVSNNSLASVTATGHTFTVLDNKSAAGAPWIGNAYECSAASGSPVFTMTSTSSDGGGDSQAILYEVQGNATSAPCVDGHSTNDQSSPGTGPNGITSGAAIAVTTNGEFFIGATYSGCCTPPTVSLGTNVAWTNLHLTVAHGSNVLNTEQFAQATAASLNATFTEGTNVRAETLILGILPSGGGGATRGLFQTPSLGGLGIGGSFFRDPLQFVGLAGWVFAVLLACAVATHQTLKAVDQVQAHLTARQDARTAAHALDAKLKAQMETQQADAKQRELLKVRRG